MNWRRSRHGVSTFLVIGLLGLVALTLTAIGRHFTHQVRRTQRYAAEAQLRQLLLAGEISARTGQAAPLPQSLAHARLTIERDGQAFVITTTLDGQTARQRVTYAERDGRRVLVAANLEIPP